MKYSNIYCNTWLSTATDDWLLSRCNGVSYKAFMHDDLLSIDWSQLITPILYLEQELGAIYLLEMTKCLTGIFGKGLTWDIQNRTS